MPTINQLVREFKKVCGPAPRPERTVTQHLADIGVRHKRIGHPREHRLIAADGNTIDVMDAYEAARFCMQAECAA